jgi:hypothetical protein
MEACVGLGGEYPLGINFSNRDSSVIVTVFGLNDWRLIRDKSTQHFFMSVPEANRLFSGCRTSSWSCGWYS